MTLEEARERLRAAVEASGMTHDEIGKKMGYNPPTERQAVWRLLNGPNDPGLSKILQLAEVLGVPLSEILEPARRRSRKKKA